MKSPEEIKKLIEKFEVRKHPMQYEPSQTEKKKKADAEAASHKISDKKQKKEGDSKIADHALGTVTSGILKFDRPGSKPHKDAQKRQTRLDRLTATRLAEEETEEFMMELARNLSLM